MARWLARGERQGWSWVELSRRSGLPAWKLRWWRARLKQKPCPGKPAPSFVAVEIGEPARTPSAAIAILTPSGFRLEAPPDFDVEHLRRLLRVLEPGC